MNDRFWTGDDNPGGTGGATPPRYGYYNVNRRTGRGSGREEKKRSSFGALLLKTAAAAIVFGLVSGLVLRAVYMVPDITGETASPSVISRTEPLNHEETVPSDTYESMETGASSVSSITGKGAVADVAAECMPAVVAITTVSIQEIPDFFGYGSQRYESAGSGSGIIVGENEDELLIATNNHVVSGASTLSVLFIGGDDQTAAEFQSLMDYFTSDLNYDGAVSASIKGTDADNDLAVVAVNKADIPSDTMSRIKIASLGDSDDLVVGEQVVAIGNALGYGQSVTSGWVSALNRSISTGTSVAEGLIQTDAAINPGNSGGALLNMNGEVVGINSAKYADSRVEGMGYAIPISKASPILNELMTRETRTKADSSSAAYLGVSVADMGWEASRMYDIPEGAFVAEAFEGGAAYNAGIQQGDIIMELDGYPVQDRTDLIEKLAYYRAGETVEVVIARKNASGVYEQQSVYVTMGSRPQEG